MKYTLCLILSVMLALAPLQVCEAVYDWRAVEIVASDPSILIAYSIPTEWITERDATEEGYPAIRHYLRERQSLSGGYVYISVIPLDAQVTNETIEDEYLAGVASGLGARNIDPWELRGYKAVRGLADISIGDSEYPLRYLLSIIKTQVLLITVSASDLNDAELDELYSRVESSVFVLPRDPDLPIPMYDEAPQPPASIRSASASTEETLYNEDAVIISSALTTSDYYNGETEKDTSLYFAPASTSDSAIQVHADNAPENEFASTGLSFAMTRVSDVPVRRTPRSNGQVVTTLAAAWTPVIVVGDEIANGVSYKAVSVRQQKAYIQADLLEPISSDQYIAWNGITDIAGLIGSYGTNFAVMATVPPQETGWGSTGSNPTPKPVSAPRATQRPQAPTTARPTQVPMLQPTQVPTLQPTRVPTPPPTPAPVPQTAMVWVPTKGGSKYHSNPSCSGMIDPRHVTINQAVGEGFSPCSKCW